jgi:putative PIN family toxin of toxin-antitoxin system
MIVVLDTNILVSALLNPEGAPAAIINLLLSGKLTVLYDNRLLKEYGEVLRRTKFPFKKSSVLHLLDYIRREGQFVVAEPIDIPISEDDKAFYKVAKAGNAQYLITGNKKHFPNVRIVKTPKEFIEGYLGK